MCEFLLSGAKFSSYFIPPYFIYLISEYLFTAVTWVYSRRKIMSDDTQKEVNKILKNFDLSLDDLEPVSQDCRLCESP